MKKTCILFTLLSLVIVHQVHALDVTFGQKVNNVWQPIPNGGTISLSCKQNYVIDEYIRVQNNTTLTFCLYMSKSYVQKQATSFTDAFCWDKCYSQYIYKSDGCLSFTPGQARDMDFHALYDPQKNVGETIIKYTFWVNGSAGDSSFVIIHLISQPLGIGEPEEVPAISLSPNPCSGKVVFALGSAGSGQGRIIISDLLGKRVLSLGIPVGATEVTADLSSLCDGVYIYFQETAGLMGCSKKLLIRK
ncbi:MAG: hypothetical protein NTW31_10220 [Bacteroidetes bacterium]|nr:hypothetical protein [Bacteroidota bacterium]